MEETLNKDLYDLESTTTSEEMLEEESTTTSEEILEEESTITSEEILEEESATTSEEILEEESTITSEEILEEESTTSEEVFYSEVVYNDTLLIEELQRQNDILTSIYDVTTFIFIAILFILFRTYVIHILEYIRSFGK